MMKIAVINRHRFDAVGGSEIQSDIVARGLADKGHDVTYLAIEGDADYSSLPYKVISVPLTSKAIAAACLAVKPTVVYWRFNKHSLRHVAKTLSSYHIPFVFAVSHINDLRPWGTKPSPLSTVGAKAKELLVQRWNFSGYKWVSGIVCQLQEQLVRAPIAKAIVIPNSGQLTNDRSFSWPRPYIAWVSNIKPAKRPELCVKLAQQLSRHDLDILMVGRMVDPSYGWLAEESATPRNLRYLGPRSVEEVDGILRGATALIHTCLQEGFPNVLIQAWLQGIPTVSFEFDPGGFIESNGLGYVSQGDEEQFCRDVENVITKPDLARRVGEAARLFARELCAPKANVARLEAFLAEVTEADGRCLASVNATRRSSSPVRKCWRMAKKWLNTHWLRAIGRDMPNRQPSRSERLPAAPRSICLNGAFLTNLNAVNSGSPINRAGRLVLHGESSGERIKLYEASSSDHARFIEAACKHKDLADCFPQILTVQGRLIVTQWIEDTAEARPSLETLVELQRRLHELPIGHLPHSGFDYWHDFIRPRFARAVELLGDDISAARIPNLVGKAWTKNQVLMHPDLTPANIVLDNDRHWRIVDNELLTLGGLPLLDVCNTAFALGPRGRAFAQMYLNRKGIRPTQDETEILRAAWVARLAGSSFVNGDLKTAVDVLRDYQQGKSLLPFDREIP